MKNVYTGPWRDEPMSSLRAALDDLRLHSEDYIACQRADGVDLVPVLRDALHQIDCEFLYSESRQQWRTKLRRTVRRDVEEVA